MSQIIFWRCLNIETNINAQSTISDNAYRLTSLSPLVLVLMSTLLHSYHRGDLWKPVPTQGNDQCKTNNETLVVPRTDIEGISENTLMSDNGEQEVKCIRLQFNTTFAIVTLRFDRDSVWVLCIG